MYLSKGYLTSCCEVKLATRSRGSDYNNPRLVPHANQKRIDNLTSAVEVLVREPKEIDTSKPTSILVPATDGAPNCSDRQRFQYNGSIFPFPIQLSSNVFLLLS